MVQQRYVAKWFLCLVCLVTLLCIAQRMTHLYTLEYSAEVEIAAITIDDDALLTSPCELIAKLLLTATPILLEQLFFAFGLLLLLSLPPGTSAVIFSPSYNSIALHVTGAS